MIQAQKHPPKTKHSGTPEGSRRKGCKWSQRWRAHIYAKWPFCHWCGNFLCDGDRAPFMKKLGVRPATLEHLTRLTDGGTNDENNLSIACGKCNKTR